MLRKALLSITVALVSLSLLVIGVVAQSPSAPTIGAESAQISSQAAALAQADITSASVVQTVPVTLTLTIPGPNGPVTVEVPIYLSLDIRIGISPQLTTTLSVTPSVVTEGEVTPTVTAESTDEDVAVETVEPTATPSLPLPTATSVPAEAEPTEVPLPTATPTATVAPEPEIVSAACADTRAAITSPGVNQILSGNVNIIGTASHENFQYYKVEYAQGAGVDPNNSFSYLADGRVQVVGALLAAFNSTNFTNGAYTIKLTVVDNSGNFPPPCTVSVVIEN